MFFVTKGVDDYNWGKGRAKWVSTHSGGDFKIGHFFTRENLVKARMNWSYEVGHSGCFRFLHCYADVVISVAENNLKIVVTDIKFANATIASPPHISNVKGVGEYYSTLEDLIFIDCQKQVEALTKFIDNATSQMFTAIAKEIN